MIITKEGFWVSWAAKTKLKFNKLSTNKEEFICVSKKKKSKHMGKLQKKKMKVVNYILKIQNMEEKRQLKMAKIEETETKKKQSDRSEWMTLSKSNNILWYQ